MNTPQIDHYLQADIVNKLYTDKECSFTELKPDDIENSLFMYHVRKLEDRGIVERTGDGFQLTLNGTRWVNFIGPSTLRPKMLPRLLINFVVTNPDQTKVLLSRRKGQSAEHLNKYLLPGGLYEYGMDLASAAKHTLEVVGLPIETALNYWGIIEVLNHLEDDFIYHTVSTYFTGKLDTDILPETEHYDSEWVDVNSITTEKYGEVISQILQKFQANDLQPFETITAHE